MRLTLLPALFLAASLPAQPSLDSLHSRIARRVASTPGAVVGVYFKDFRGGAELAFNADSMFHAASTMKVPVMIEYFRGVDAGRFSPVDSMLLENRFASIVDGSSYSLDAGEDSDSSMYAKIGQRVPLAELVERMITRSSNLATNAMIGLVGAERANATAHALGARTIRVLRGVEDTKAFNAGLNNSTSARDMGALFDALGRGTAASGKSTASMLTILGRQEFNDEIPAGLPAGTRVAHKTGWITGVLNDAALVYPGNREPFVLVVLTRGIADEKVARSLIQDIARLVWGAAVGGGA